jgi:hypothetical protein
MLLQNGLQDNFANNCSLVRERKPQIALPSIATVSVSRYGHHVTGVCDLEEGGISWSLINHFLVARRRIHLQT